MKAWRQIARPHKDVLQGTFKQSEFAADLSQVVAGTATPEYQDAKNFFARTYITEGMKILLISVIKRIAGLGGDPVIQLQTNFGGGKTHTLLAVYHLASSQVPATELAGIPPLLDGAEVLELPQAKIAVIDGTDLSPNEPRKTREGLLLRTLWGNLAYQLLGVDGYSLVEQSDINGTAPGKEVIIALLKKTGPTVVLMDETVAFVRQLDDSHAHQAGSFGANISFIQVLTESVKSVPNAILLASLPESNTEVAGSFGEKALLTLEKYFGRLETVWKPVAADESFEIVRRRLFDTTGNEADKEETCKAFDEFYRVNRDRFPTELQQGDYLGRLRQSYPIHPEIFDRLYEDWSTLDKFQRTRGVLQYMAIIIHNLWNSGNQDALILPGSIPLEDPVVRGKSVHYLPSGWDSIIENEIAGPRSTAYQIDSHDTLFGSVTAAQRSARTIFLGSAPSTDAQAVRGISKERILLGSIQPGQNIGAFEDVLRRLSDQLHYLYTDSNRFWFNLTPNLRREMENRKARISGSEIEMLVREQLRTVCGSNAMFSGVHIFSDSADIPDEIGAGLRLVILPPASGTSFLKGAEEPLFNSARAILSSRGSQPRLRRNRIIFLVAQSKIVSRLQDQCKTVLAWQSICADIDEVRVNLGIFQVRDARKNLEQTKNILRQVIAECFSCMLIPHQPDARKQEGFEVRILKPGLGSLAQAAERLLTEEEFVITRWSPGLFKAQLSALYFKDGITEVSAEKVWHDFCSYIYMQRLLNESVFEEVIRKGLESEDFFGFAQGKENGDYLGFCFGSTGFITFRIDNQMLLLEKSAAAAYKAKLAVPADVPPAGDSTTGGNPSPSDDNASTPTDGGSKLPLQPRKKCTHFYGMKQLDINRVGQDALTVTEEIIQHLTNITTNEVTVKISIEAKSAGGTFDDATVRTILENSRSLRFVTAEFSE